ncbi:MAG: hypothetical protein COB23_06090 [Methylophaga sp.]|nr:MAG: hypothetical protein COB23_06090 [Methylophaga sp.]
MKLIISRLFIVSICIWLICACTEQQQVNNFVKGSFENIQKHYQGKAYLIMFWSEDCAYCMKELEQFGQTLQQHPEINLITVATDPFLDKDTIRSTLASFNLQQMEAWVFAMPHAETLYFDVDKRWRGELPLTFLFDEHHKKTKITGLITEEVFLAWLTKND